MKFLDPYLTGLGIDVSDHHLRLAQVGFFGSVLRVHEVVLPEGLIVDDQVEKPDDLKAILKDTFTTLGLSDHPYRTSVLVAESRVFSHSVLIQGSVKGEERKTRAREAAQREIPVPFSQAQVCTALGGKEGDQTRMAVCVIEKKVFEPLHAVFSGGLLRLVAMEANTKSLFRVLTKYAGETLQTIPLGSLIAIVDVGHAWTTLSLYRRSGENVFSRTIPNGLKEKINGKTIELSKGVVDSIIGTINETVLFFEQTQKRVGLVIFAGVEAQDDRFKETLSKGDEKFPTHLISDIIKIEGISKIQLHAFGSAIGVALRSARPGAYQQQHNFLSK